MGEHKLIPVWHRSKLTHLRGLNWGKGTNVLFSVCPYNQVMVEDSVYCVALRLSHLLQLLAFHFATPYGTSHHSQFNDRTWDPWQCRWHFAFAIIGSEANTPNNSADLRPAPLNSDTPRVSESSAMALQAAMSLISMTTPRSLEPQSICLAPSFVEFDMSLEGYGYHVFLCFPLCFLAQPPFPTSIFTDFAVQFTRMAKNCALMLFLFFVFLPHCHIYTLPI